MNAMLGAPVHLVPGRVMSATHVVNNLQMCGLTVQQFVNASEIRQVGIVSPMCVQALKLERIRLAFVTALELLEIGH